MSKSSELVKGLRSKAPKGESEKRYSSWGGCSAHGCRLHASANNGAKLCTYHHGVDPQYWGRVTEAIEENSHLIKKLMEMTYWSSGMWSERMPSIQGWDWCRMHDNEPPSAYLVRFSKRIRESIADMASEGV